MQAHHKQPHEEARKLELSLLSYFDNIMEEFAKGTKIK